MSRRMCKTCGATYNSNDPGRMTVCLNCMPPVRYDLEQEETFEDDPSKDCEGLYDDCEDCPRNFSCVADFKPPCVETSEPYNCNDPNCEICKNTNTMTDPLDEPLEDEHEYHSDTCNCDDCNPDPITPPSGFIQDFRKTNPALHLLYVKWAVRHLAMVRKMIGMLMDESNLNTYDFARALVTQCETHIAEQAAYADAHEILESIELK